MITIIVLKFKQLGLDCKHTSKNTYELANSVDLYQIDM